MTKPPNHKMGLAKTQVINVVTKKRLLSPCLGKDNNLDTLGGIYLHVLVIYLPLGYLESYTINFTKLQVVKCCVKILWF
jgi:hypothetical protein